MPGAGNRDKKMAALDVVIVLFQVYFRLNTLRMCKSLINAVNSPQFLPFAAFPASQRVTYRFFVGRLAIFDEDYVRPALYLRAPDAWKGMSPLLCHRVAGCGRCALYVRALACRDLSMHLPPRRCEGVASSTAVSNCSKAHGRPVFRICCASCQLRCL